ncbi:plasma protease C1 inhibitor [Hemicordylus capensis]|uniref:plasma protease C1 inhibitor n=1 Tax=Hemicordylus capensis TaxID=884348 RepID=UPI00230449E0|nr:plasma protease C1 inhibitor [Hemicordylus capensis]
MKTWLILLYLATLVVSSFSEDVFIRKGLDNKTKEAEPPLPFQGGESEQGWTTNTNSKGTWPTLNISPRKLLRFSFLDSKKNGTEDQQTESSETATTQTRRSVETQTMSNVALHGPFSNVTLDKENEDDKEINKPNGERKEENNERDFHAWNGKGDEKDRSGGTHASEQLRCSEDSQECLNATEPSTRDPTTVKSTTTPTTTEQMTTTSKAPERCPPLRNPWAACGNEATAEDKVKLAEALTEFALKFYAKAIEYEKRDSNMVFSPISISVVLSILLLGAREETKTRLEELLSSEDITCVHTALKEFLNKSEALTSASAIFYTPELTLDEDFHNLTERFYQVHKQHLTNNSNQDVIDINAWVDKHTDHKIKKLLNELEPDLPMVLLSAVFFHSKWKTMFKKENTEKAVFFRPGLPNIRVPMMTSEKYPVAFFIDNYLAAKVGQLQLSDNMNLIIITPQYQQQNLSDVEKRLHADVFKSVMTRLESTTFKPTIVTLPKFKVDSSQDLLSIVGGMDYGIFYDANLCGVSADEEVAVSSAQHRAVLEISEEGVEAAATTMVSVARTANAFEVRQPFIFIVMKNNQFPVFMGRVNNPRRS